MISNLRARLGLCVLFSLLILSFSSVLSAQGKKDKPKDKKPAVAAPAAEPSAAAVTAADPDKAALCVRRRRAQRAGDRCDRNKGGKGLLHLDFSPGDGAHGRRATRENSQRSLQTGRHGSKRQNGQSPVNRRDLVVWKNGAFQAVG